jgi:SAM-dependent methyltransferase
VVEVYDRIGTGYRNYRRPDRRIAAAIIAALGDAVSVVNVGAGAGSYEPKDHVVIAVEPSGTMVRQRPRDASPVVRASAMALPFGAKSFDAVLAVLTVHHWPDQALGLQEMSRVARRRCVILTWDPSTSGAWPTRDYFPGIAEFDRTIFPSLELYRRIFARIAIVPVPIPHDCSDGFLTAYWRRPAAYLDAGARSAISSFACVTHKDVADGVARLKSDLDDGTWRRQNGHLIDLPELDVGYRIIIAETDPYTSPGDSASAS